MKQAKKMRGKLLCNNILLLSRLPQKTMFLGGLALPKVK
jgi:hypothetical protein